MAGASVNKVILVGNLGGDPEVRYTGSGKAVASFTVATTSRAGRDREPTTEWHKIVVWDKLAELCGQYLHKGRQVFLEGRLQTRAWDDKTGNKRYTTEVVAHDVVFLGGGRGRDDAYGADEQPHRAPRPAPPQQQQRGFSSGGYSSEPPQAEIDDMPPSSFPNDDDIPF